MNATQQVAASVEETESPSSTLEPSIIVASLESQLSEAVSARDEAVSMAEAAAKRATELEKALVEAETSRDAATSARHEALQKVEEATSALESLRKEHDTLVMAKESRLEELRAAASDALLQASAAEAREKEAEQALAAERAESETKLAEAVAKAETEALAASAACEEAKAEAASTAAELDRLRAVASSASADAQEQIKAAEDARASLRAALDAKDVELAELREAVAEAHKRVDAANSRLIAFETAAKEHDEAQPAAAQQVQGVGHHPSPGNVQNEMASSSMPSEDDLRSPLVSAAREAAVREYNLRVRLEADLSRVTVERDELANALASTEAKAVQMKIRVDGEGSESHSQEVVHVVPELSPASRESLATRVADAEAAEAATREELHAATLKVAELEERLASAEHAEADVRMRYDAAAAKVAEAAHAAALGEAEMLSKLAAVTTRADEAESRLAEVLGGCDVDEHAAQSAALARTATDAAVEETRDEAKRLAEELRIVNAEADTLRGRLAAAEADLAGLAEMRERVRAAESAAASANDDAVAALAARDQLTRAQEAVSELQHLLTSAEDSNKVTQRALDDALFVIQTCFT